MTCKHGFPAPDEAYWAGTVAPTCSACEIEKLRAEIEQLRPDAERYRELKANQLGNCMINPLSSRVCILGTKSCVMKHTGIVERDKRIAELEEEVERLTALWVDVDTENERLRAGLGEALDWNWLDDDAPHYIRKRLVKLIRSDAAMEGE